MKLWLVLVALVVVAPLQGMTKTATFEVSGWTCGSCASATRIALKKLDGVEDVKTDHQKREALVTYDDSKVTTDKMVQTIARLGYRAAVKNSAVPARSAATQSGGAPVPATDTVVSAERVSFFEVPLECGAAENLGCGSAAKPILSELDGNPKVAEARINRPGTILAAVWKNPGDRSDAAVEALFEKHNLAAATLKGEARETALKDYQPSRWYGSKDVDRLSEQEARVIAARLVDRARAHFDLSPQRLAALTEDLAVIFARHLTLRDEECDTRSDVITQELADAAKKHLNPLQLAELRKAGEQGIQALPGESR